MDIFKNPEKTPFFPYNGRPENPIAPSGGSEIPRPVLRSKGRFRPTHRRPLRALLPATSGPPRWSGPFPLRPVARGAGSGILLLLSLRGVIKWSGTAGKDTAGGSSTILKQK